ncbi:alpha/beta hydrolase [Paraburkholderia sp. CNPSo 3272]|uniref:alpha/beta hydrolase n=1 Tax=Paraburkholderia sp. CNPSo 3272 TaxID=2940931 RepID=UPI0020B6E40F|nr:alpha/beta hydrolase [Paraburkholderia sp. CNPSo 3272]MCP3723341.1 alpha/beta hydrolase [Paraburkholderia sp. CNPSo 3272]
MSSNALRRLAGVTAAIAASALIVAPALAQARPLRPVSVIADARMPVDTPAGHAQLPLYLSADWNVPQPAVQRAVVIVHGRLRNADTYFRTAQHARELAGVDPAGTLLVAPQFLATADVSAHHAAGDLLSWRGNAWMAGADAASGAPVSSYAVLEDIARHLADRRLFPNLKTIVFAGHSGGAQVLQRYAIVASTDALTAAGIDVRFVVASPSSYAYFDAQRPDASGAPVAFDASRCTDFDRWKYGMENRPASIAGRTPAQLEADYVKRRIVYLAGGSDDDPASVSLDKSCAAQAQGPQRVARAQGFYRYLQTRHPDGLNQTFHIVPGVGHDGARMLTSSCALATMFDTAGCAP